jgi:hypothetical protein
VVDDATNQVLESLLEHLFRRLGRLSSRRLSSGCLRRLGYR